MKRIYALLLILMLSLSLSGCEWLTIHRLHVQQGNLITADKVRLLQRGMSKQQVLDLMGTPVYDNVFAMNRWVYVYTSQRRSRQRLSKHVIVTFKDDKIAYLNFS